eukprot:274914-Chlamydomonas_euryale.AAC.1
MRCDRLLGGEDQDQDREDQEADDPLRRHAMVLQLTAIVGACLWEVLAPLCRACVVHVRRCGDGLEASVSRHAPEAGAKVGAGGGAGVELLSPLGQ